MSTPTSEMNKLQLRAACKEAKIKGWGNMNNAQMRASLEAVAKGEPVAKVERKAPADKPKVKREKRAEGVPSVREWLEKRVAQYGSVKLEDAKAFVKESKRSLVTMYRQAQELELVIDREAKVFKKAS